MMTKPRAKRARRTDTLDPNDPDYMHPAELERLQKEFFDRVDHLVAVYERKAIAAGLNPDGTWPIDDAPGPHDKSVKDGR